MKIRIQIVIEAGNGEPEKIEEIARLERGSLQPEELGLTLAEAKALSTACNRPWSPNRSRIT